MKTKDMREFLKDKVETVPRSNADVEKLYNEMNGITVQTVEPVHVESVEVKPTEISTGDEYTYVGYGDTPPHMINFMGLQVFMRGTPVKVTDPRVLEKVKVNRSFVKGKADINKMHEQDELAAKRAQKQREEDLKMQIEVERQNRAKA